MSCEYPAHAANLSGTTGREGGATITSRARVGEWMGVLARHAVH